MDAILEILTFLLYVALFIAMWIGPTVFLLWTGYSILSSALKRRERVQLLLHLLGMTLNAGRPIEETIISLARRKDLTFGVSFHLLAAYLRKGMPFMDALQQVPNLLPTQIVEVLRAGARLGDIRKVLPVCVRISRDAISQTRGLLNYLLVISFAGWPTTWILFFILRIYVFPQLHAVFSEITGKSSLGLDFLVAYGPAILALQAVVILGSWLMIVFYVLGPRPLLGFGRGIKPLVDGFMFRIPWKRKRFQRDFTTMLGCLLDAQVPEADAVMIAANCTDNSVFIHNARAAVAQLQSGMALPQAVTCVDKAPEFGWRVTNALQTHASLRTALAGWGEYLDAKAFQDEQAFHQTFSTTLVLLNGLFVGLIVVSVFSGLISILNAAALW